MTTVPFGAAASSVICECLYLPACQHGQALRRRVIGRVWRGTLFLLIILNPSRLPLRPTLSVGRLRTRQPSPGLARALINNAIGDHRAPLAARKFHHFQSVWLKTPLDGGGASPQQRLTDNRNQYFNA